MHVDLSLPSSVAPGVTRGKDLKVEVVKTVGGRSIRNKLWGTALRSYEVPFPPMDLTDPDLKAIEELWDAVDGATHTFDHYDEVSDERVRVRFVEDQKLNLVHVEGPMWRFDTLLVVEERL